MEARVELSVTRSARLVLDVREWFASTFGPASAPLTLKNDDGTRRVVRTIVRPEAPLTLTARPTSPRHPRWPFPGEVELVTVRTPSGVLAFYGRVRAPGGGPLRRLPLEGTRCLLRVAGPGYRDADLGEVGIPAPFEPTATVRVVLMPGPDYPFPPGPTVLRGGVYRPDGAGVAGVEVSPDGQPGVQPGLSDDRGQWLLVLENTDGGATIPSPTDLLLRVPGAAAPARVAGVRFQARRDNLMPQTLARGVVVRAGGGPLAGATVEVVPFPGESRTRLDGTWQFYPGLDLPLTGRRGVTVRVTAPGRPTASAGATLTLGEANDVPPITV